MFCLFSDCSLLLFFPIYLNGIIIMKII